MAFRRVVFLVLCAAEVLAPLRARAEEARRVEIVEVRGIIDGSVERSILTTISAAERERAELVVLQIDSGGVIDRARTERLASAIRHARVPVAVWLGPPGAEARNGAALLVYAAHVGAISPLSSLGPVETLDLRMRASPRGELPRLPADRTLHELAKAASLPELLDKLDGRRVEIRGGPTQVSVANAGIRFHKLDIFGRVLHAAAQPSIAYLLLLLALVGIVFELFHPSTGPAGIAGLAAFALALYGIVTLGGSWLGFALIVLGVAGFAVDLRYQSLGYFTLAGFGALVAGSLLLFHGPWLHVSPWVLAFGITGMVLFLVGAMTRVLGDLRAVARGELEVREAHEAGGSGVSPDEKGGS